MQLKPRTQSRQQKKDTLQLDTIIFVNHLNLLVGHDQQHIYGKTTKQKIINTINNFPIIDNQGNQFTLFSNIENFKKFSPSIYLMFHLIKHIIIMFCIIGIISLIQFIFLIKSPYYTGFQNIVRINMLRLTIASLQPQYYNIYIILDLISIIFVAGCFIWWNQKLRYFAKQCNQSNKLPSYLTVQLRSIPENFSQIGLRKQLQNNYGIFPHSIYIGKDYGKFINYYSDLTQTAINFRVSKELYLRQQNQLIRKKQAYPLIKQFFKLKKKYFQIKSQQFNQTHYKTKQVFIVLQNYFDRQKLLQSQPTYLTYLFKTIIKDQNVFAFKACHVQPQAIAWQNIGISTCNYLLRLLIVFIVLCTCTCFGTIIIFLLQVLETASIGDTYYFNQKTMFEKYSISNESIPCITPNQCKTIQSDPWKLVLLIILTPLTIFIFKKLIMSLLSHTVNFRKYPDQVSKIKSQTITLSFFYFTVVGLLHLVLYLKTQINHTQISLYQLLYPIITKLFNLTNYNPSSINMFNDFSLDWYKQSTFFIVIISSTSFNVSNAFKFIVGYFKFLLQKKHALKQKTIYGVNKILHGIDLHLENIYASMHAIVLFALLYGCPIPITVIFSLVNLIFLFYTCKWTFIRYATKPLRMGHSLSRVSINILLIGVVIHCIMAPIFLGATGIAQNNSHYFYTILHPQLDLEQDTKSLSQRYQNLGPFYLTLAFSIVIYMTCRKIFLNHILTALKKTFSKIVPSLSSSQLTTMSKQYQHFGLYPSYSMHENKKYSQVLRNVYILNKSQAKRSKFLPQQLYQNFKIFDSWPMKSRVFSQILQLSRKYLYQQKYQQFYYQLQNIAKISGYTTNDDTQYLTSQSNTLHHDQSINQQILLDDNLDFIIENQK